MQRIDLDRYAARIGYGGGFAPTRAVLAALHRLHPQAIPFENLDALCGIAPSLAPEDLQRKLLQGRRGGWCFEHNLLFWSVLETIGFRVGGLAARVLWQQPADARPGRSHMLLRVESAEGPCLADVGFGGLTLTAPLSLEADVVQDTPHGRYVLRRDRDVWQLDALLPQGPAPMYRFDLSPQLPVDYAYANWFLATNAASPFAGALVLARPVEDGRHSYRSGEYTWRPVEGLPHGQRLATPAALRALLESAFCIDVPAALDDARLASLLHNEPQ
ncbi:MAG: Arylamine N-acetyltransferase [Pseudomonadota bacterium]